MTGCVVAGFPLSRHGDSHQGDADPTEKAYLEEQKQRMVELQAQVDQEGDAGGSPTPNPETEH